MSQSVIVILPDGTDIEEVDVYTDYNIEVFVAAIPSGKQFVRPLILPSGLKTSKFSPQSGPQALDVTTAVL